MCSTAKITMMIKTNHLSMLQTQCVAATTECMVVQRVYRLYNFGVTGCTMNYIEWFHVLELHAIYRGFLPYATFGTWKKLALAKNRVRPNFYSMYAVTK